MRLGYLCDYSGKQLEEAINEFLIRYPNMKIDIVSGTHEKIYDLLRFGDVDIILNDLRRAFSNEYINFHLKDSDCYICISDKHPLSDSEAITLKQLENYPCIIISSKNQQDTEQIYYQTILEFGSEIIFAKSIDEAMFKIVGGNGFMLIDEESRLLNLDNVKIVPIYKNNERLKRYYYAFWKQDNDVTSIKEFAEILKERFNK